MLNEDIFREQCVEWLIDHLLTYFPSSFLTIPAILTIPSTHIEFPQITGVLYVVRSEKIGICKNREDFNTDGQPVDQGRCTIISRR